MAHNADGRAIVAIGAFAFIKGLILTVVATGVLALLGQDVQQTVAEWVKGFHFDPGNRHIAAFLAKLGVVDDRQLKQLGGLTFVYGAVFLTEGVGLLMRQRWAQYLTAAATFALIPFELIELGKQFSAWKIGVLSVNLVIGFALVIHIRKQAAAR